MIRLVFSANRELIHFLIIEKNVYYTDRKWGVWIRCLPRPDNFIQKITLSRNKFPSFLIKLFEFSKEETEQYNKATNEEELAERIIQDARTKGCRLITRKDGDLEDKQLKDKILQSELVADIKKETK